MDSRLYATLTKLYKKDKEEFVIENIMEINFNEQIVALTKHLSI